MRWQVGAGVYLSMYPYNPTELTTCQPLSLEIGLSLISDSVKSGVADGHAALGQMNITTNAGGSVFDMIDVKNLSAVHCGH